jgi:small subunit ribosomal protein S17
MNKRRRLSGIVTSDKMNKTVVVEISRTHRHPLYGKVMYSKKRVMVHDELNCRMGDQVQIIESRPISRRKRWVVESILSRSEGALDVEEVST